MVTKRRIPDLVEIESNEDYFDRRKRSNHFLNNLNLMMSIFGDYEEEDFPDEDYQLEFPTYRSDWLQIKSRTEEINEMKWGKKGGKKEEND